MEQTAQQITATRVPARRDLAREARTLNDPQPGWWRCRLTKNGPLVGARIYFERHPDHELEPIPTWPNAETRILGVFGEIDGRPADPNKIWEMRGEEITEAEFLYLVSTSKWAKQHSPVHPAAQPREAVDYLTVKPPF